MKNKLEEFSKNLKMLRKSKKLSLVKLSELTGIPKSSLHEYENNLVDPGLNNAKILAEFYNVTLDFLIGYEEPIKKIAQ